VLNLSRQRILFVGGKGGVGKTTTASALAVALADSGQRCLLVSTDPAHSLGDLFGVPIGDTVRTLIPNLFALEIDPDREVDAYLAGVRQQLREFVRPAMYGEIDRQMDLTRQSPGAVEAAMLERVAALMTGDASSYDRVIFDTAPTGQTLRLLELPAVMSAWADGLLRNRDTSDALGRVLSRFRRPRAGDELSYIDQSNAPEDDPRSARIRETLLARRTRLSKARRVLLDDDVTGFILVLIPEKLPVLESRKALETLHRVGVPVRGLVINRVLPTAPLGAFLESRRAQEAAYLTQISQFPGTIPTVRIPLLAHDVTGVEELRAMGRQLCTIGAT
jgi:arsenite-transporting ATPase